MNHSERLIKKTLEEKSKISHKFDEAVNTVLSFEKYGFDPFFKKYEGKKTLTWSMSNRDSIFTDFFNKLVELEPRFKNISSPVKEDLNLAFFSKFESFFDKTKLYSDIEKINWILIYSDFKGFDFTREKNYTKEDLLFIRRLDFDYMLALKDISDKNPTLYKDYDQAFKKEDPILYYKLNPNKAS